MGVGKQNCFAFFWGQEMGSQLLGSLPWQLGKRLLLLNVTVGIAPLLWQARGEFPVQVRCWWASCMCWVIIKCHSRCVLIPGNASLAGMKHRLREFLSFLPRGSDRGGSAVQRALRLSLLPQLQQPPRSSHSTLPWTVGFSHEMRTEVFILK